MNSIRQLFRSPWKTLLGIILVLLACTLLCVSIGQYDASMQAQRKVEQDYTTIAWAVAADTYTAINGGISADCIYATILDNRKIAEF